MNIKHDNHRGSEDDNKSKSGNHGNDKFFKILITHFFFSKKRAKQSSICLQGIQSEFLEQYQNCLNKGIIKTDENKKFSGNYYIYKYLIYQINSIQS